MNWYHTQLDKLISMCGGGTPSKQNASLWNGDIPWVSPKDMSVREIHDSEDHITQEAVEISATQIVPAGSILVVVRSGILVRRIPIAIAQRPLAINQDIKALIPDRHLIDSKFLSYFLESKQQTLLTGYVKRGATVHSLQIDKLRKMPIQVPAVSEQRRIVEILDQADALRRKRAEADATGARILPALFYKIFGDPVTNPKDWPLISMAEVISDTRNGIYKPTSYYGHGMQILKMFNIQNGELHLNRVDLVELDEDEYNAFALLAGDILLNRVNTPELVGKCAVITKAVGKAVFESKNIRIRVNPAKAHYEYVAAYLNSPFGHASLRSGVKHAIGMATINNTDLRGMKIPLPPMALQESWADAASLQRQLQSVRSASRQQIDRLLSVLLHRAFSGDLTAKWRDAHMKELLQEMEQQTKALDGWKWQVTQPVENYKGSY